MFLYCMHHKIKFEDTGFDFDLVLEKLDEHFTKGWIHSVV